MKELIIELPIRVKKNKYKDNKHYAINLNEYRNWNYNVETSVKKKYKEIIYSKLPKIKFDKINVETQMYLKTTNKDGSQSKTRKDKGNVYAIALKYFLDSLSDKDILVDDNDNFVKQELILPTISVNHKDLEKIVFKITEVK